MFSYALASNVRSGGAGVGAGVGVGVAVGVGVGVGNGVGVGCGPQSTSQGIRMIGAGPEGGPCMVLTVCAAAVIEINAAKNTACI